MNRMFPKMAVLGLLTMLFALLAVGTVQALPAMVTVSSAGPTVENADVDKIQKEEPAVIVGAVQDNLNAPNAEKNDSPAVIATAEGVDDEVAPPEATVTEGEEANAGKGVEISTAITAEADEEMSQVPDPFEPVNRVMFTFNNDYVFKALEYLAGVYDKYVPGIVRTGVHNFIDNASAPVSIVNNLLQGNFKGFASETLRFILNTTIGFGFLDVATKWGIAKDKATCDQTLGMFFGISDWFNLEIPFLGGFSPRSLIGFAGDMALTPATYLGFYTALYGSATYSMVDAVDKTSKNASTYRSLEKDSLDFYTALIGIRRDVHKKRVEEAKKRSIFF